MNENTAPTKGELIEQRLDKTAAGALVISSDAGGVSFQNMLEVMEFSKLMALSREAVPPHLRNNPGMCLAVAIQAAEWRMSPFAVANKSYVVNDRIAWESQLVHAVIEQRAPIVGRIRHSFEGDGQERVCIVTAQVKGEVDPLVLRSPPLKQVRPEIFEKDGKKTSKGSPLWITKPDVQLYYNTVRDFARVYFPDVLMGVYSKDEMEEAPERSAVDVTPAVAGLHDRLAAAAGQEGFKSGVVEAGLNGDHDSKPKRTKKDKATGESPPPAGDPGGQAAGQSHDPATPGASSGAAQEPAGELKAQGPTTQAEPKKTAQAASPARPAKDPTNPAEYLEYARAWMAAATTAEEIDTRWKKERSLRNAVGLTSDERAPLEAEKKARTAQLGGGQ